MIRATLINLTNGSVKSCQVRSGNGMRRITAKLRDQFRPS